MVPTSFLIWFAVVEAVTLWQIYTWNRPNKENREKIKEFAEENDISVNTATNHIIRMFFKAYENGLREKMREANEKKDSPSFEEWKKLKDQEGNPPRPKQIVKPIKKSRSR